MRRQSIRRWGLAAAALTLAACNQQPQQKQADTTASEVKASDFDAIVIPGGYSPDHMRRHKAMVDLVTQAARQG